MFGKKEKEIKRTGKEVKKIQLDVDKKAEEVILALYNKENKKTFISLTYEQASDLTDFLVDALGDFNAEESSDPSDYKEVE